MGRPDRAATPTHMRGVDPVLEEDRKGGRTDQIAGLTWPSVSDLYINRRGPAAGLPIVFSHGMGDDSTIWDDVVAALPSAYRTIAWDLPGHGQSAELTDPNAYDARLSYASLEALLTLEPGPVILGGHSLGGYISCRYAIEHPEKTAALILVATGPGFRDDGARAKWNDNVRATAESSGRPAQLLGLHDDAFVIDNLERIACPTLLIVGDRDKAFLGATDYIERKLSGRPLGVTRHTIADSGHGVVRSHGAKVAQLISDFLGVALAP